MPQNYQQSPAKDRKSARKHEWSFDFGNHHDVAEPDEDQVTIKLNQRAVSRGEIKIY